MQKITLKVSGKKYLISILLVFLFVRLNPVFAQSEEVTTIRIENARETSYAKDEQTGNDTIILTGNVKLSVEKGSTVSEIEADKVTYDRKTEMLYAQTDVTITTKSASTGSETTTADSLLLNTSTLEGFFDNGKVVKTQTDALNLPSGSTLIVFSDLFGKTQNNVIAFKNSSLTFCDDEDSHWKIKATRTWLLPGGEFAFFNALLYVGSVPVMYFPAFYYPKDEFIFNPVFSYRRREGYTVQNTLYLLGRKPLDTSTDTKDSSKDTAALDGIYNFMKPTSLKKQKLEGLVLHNLDEDYTGPTSDYLKIMLDWYSNLGISTGLAGNFSSINTYISKIDFKAMFAWSNTIFREGNLYVPHYVNQNNEVDEIKDKSTFLGIKMPFRYGFDFNMNVSKPFSLTVNLPLYSDPFFSYDFNNRSEYMNWINYFTSLSSAKTAEVSPYESNALKWNISGSFSPSIPDSFRPYVTSFNMNWNTTVNFSSSYDNSKNTYSPERKFYYPSQVNPLNGSLSLAGTIFQFPSNKKSTVKKSENKNLLFDLHKPEDLLNPGEIEKLKASENKNEKIENTEIELKQAKENNSLEKDLEPSFPILNFSSVEENLSKGLNYSLAYNLSPSVVTQLAYSSGTFEHSEDFNWKNIRSYMYTVKMPLNFTSNLNYGGNFISVTNKISYNPVWQEHPYISNDGSPGSYTDSERKSLLLADYKAEAQTIENSNTIGFYPFVATEHFSETGFYWNSSLKLFRRNFIGDVDNPDWEDLYLDWSNKDCVTTNTLNGVFGTSQKNKTFKQTLTLSTVLPPQFAQYTANLNLVFPYVTANFAAGIREVNAKDSYWEKNPLQQSLSLELPIFSKIPAFVENMKGFYKKPLYSFFDFMNSKIKFTESVNYNLEENNWDSFKLSLNWKSISLSYIASYTYGYDLIENKGWTVRDEKEFLPYSFSFSFAPATKTYYRWFNRISIAPSVNASIVADLIRPTNSYLSVAPSLSFKIADFLTISFSATTKNSILYWYFHEGNYDEWGPFPLNMFKDLADSFRFDNEDLRKHSGFKLKSLNMNISHDLHDWTFNMSMKIEPRVIIDGNQHKYDFSPYITIGIVWNPMDSIKTSVVDKYGTWSLE